MQKNQATGKECAGDQGEKRKGLEFMARRMNVAYKMIELQATKAITFSESVLLQAIELGTIGGQNETWQILEKAEFIITDLSKTLGYKTPNKIYPLLNSLVEKKLITREKTRHRGTEMLGFNRAYFDQVLIDSQQKIADKKTLKCVVDNSKKTPDKIPTKYTNHPTEIHETCKTDTRTGENDYTKHVKSDSQDTDIIEEKSSLECIRINKNLKKGNFGESFTLDGAEERERHREKVMQQYADIKSGKLNLG